MGLRKHERADMLFVHHSLSDVTHWESTASVNSLSELRRIKDPLDILDALFFKDFILDFGLDAEYFLED